MHKLILQNTREEPSHSLIVDHGNMSAVLVDSDLLQVDIFEQLLLSGRRAKVHRIALHSGVSP